MTEKKSTKENYDWSTLKGKFFHDFDHEGYVVHQGMVLDMINTEIVAIQYFDWAVGAPSTVRLVWIRDIVDNGWALYPSAEDMRDAYEHSRVKSRKA